MTRGFWQNFQKKYTGEWAGRFSMRLFEKTETGDRTERLTPIPFSIQQKRLAHLPPFCFIAQQARLEISSRRRWIIHPLAQE